MRKYLDGLYLYSAYAAGVCLVLIFLLMMFMSAGRGFGLNIPAGDDFASWLMAACAFLGLAHTFKQGEMIRVGLLIDRFTGRTKHFIELALLIIGIACIGYFTWHAVRFNFLSWRFHEVSTGVVSVPMWIPQLGYTYGLVVLFIAFVDEFFIVLSGRLPTYHKEPPKTAEEAIERAISSAV